MNPLNTSLPIVLRVKRELEFRSARSVHKQRNTNTMPSFRTGLALALAMVTLLPGVARADRSCNALFARLRAVGQPSLDGNFVHVLWTTNYFLPSPDHRFMGATSLVMNTQPNGDMTASGTRHLLYTTLEPISLRIRNDGKMIFNELYGPYDPVCNGDRFALVNTGDSIEVFGMKPIVYGQ